MTREELIEKILKVEALFQGTDVHGEKIAAQTALQRLKAQLAAHPEPEEEFQLSLPDPWKRRLFLALARRHGIRPYRRPRQRYTTVMIKVARRYLEHILWPEFLELSAILSKYLEEATNDIIARGVHRDLSEAPEQPNLPPA
jgi:hypothetical protein